MISLFSHDDFAALGLATALDIERIPYRRIRRLAESDPTLLIALGGDLSADDIRAIGRRPAVVFNGGAAFAVFGDQGHVVLGVDGALFAVEHAVQLADEPGRGLVGQL